MIKVKNLLIGLFTIALIFPISSYLSGDNVLACFLPGSNHGGYYSYGGPAYTKQENTNYDYSHQKDTYYEHKHQKDTDTDSDCNGGGNHLDSNKLWEDFYCGGGKWGSN